MTPSGFARGIRGRLGKGLASALAGLCCGCGLVSDTPSPLCSHCREALPRVQHPCGRCGVARIRDADLDSAEGICRRCRAAAPAFDCCTGAFAYGRAAAQLISSYKFQGRMDIGAALSADLAAGIHSSDGVLVAVPLHWVRLRERGFDQAGEIARRLARETGMENLSHLIERARFTAPQTEMPSARARRRNLSGAFQLRKHASFAAYPRVLIIDDVVTTGSTVSEVAKLLRAAGARRIEVRCLARADLERPKES